MDSELVTLTEAARRLRRSHQRLSQLAARPDFPQVHRIGSVVAVDWHELERWWNERPQDKGGRPRKPRA
jgi:hypothetical protein